MPGFSGLCGVAYKSLSYIIAARGICLEAELEPRLPPVFLLRLKSDFKILAVSPYTSKLHARHNMKDKNPRSRVIYLHGFASGPSSRKARLFIEKLGEFGITVEAPDLAPDFEYLTITGQLEAMENLIQGDSVVLIGSSMGGYLAALYAQKHPEVDRLVLMAPAFDFYQLWAAELGPKNLHEWRKNGCMSVFHYGKGRQLPLNYRLMQDAQQYAPFPDFQQPALILHGLNDRVVPFEKSAQFARNHSNVDLIPLTAGHDMLDVLPDIWDKSYTFLALSHIGKVPKNV